MPKVVLIHGFGSSSSRWKAEKAQFESMGYEVVTVDYKPGSPRYMNEQIDMQVARHQDADLFVGHSYGGIYLDQRESIPGNKIVTINSPTARRGYNIQGVFDPFNIVDPETAYSAVEERRPSSHWNHPSASDIHAGRYTRNAGGWRNKRSGISKALRWWTHIDDEEYFHEYWKEVGRKARMRGTAPGMYFGE